ncbi:hypothetical protein Rmet_6735 (plasmid) [Cupriavidus metallidurans CH34]|uniref:Uncharacterized protein n=1 Tax=Cupriavidus metallidurans (strain ATCC 43123 / DSM 2839 / NBRC 102507 / CH34) TaxID=266264 RepID=D3DYE4_CUPMC|nr:hypothetical protein Rmet_6735 [Cupriavidus metallidurans CH34]
MTVGISVLADGRRHPSLRIGGLRLSLSYLKKDTLTKASNFSREEMFRVIPFLGARR